MANLQRDIIDFSALERELQAAVESDRKYRQENDAKLRAVAQKVASYEEFRDLVLSSHLKPLEKNDKNFARKQPWNPLVVPGNDSIPTKTPDLQHSATGGASNTLVKLGKDHVSS
ncbi:dynein axonemal assembly factor 19 isoform 1-T1 [Aulostomus maculatus]